MMADVQQTIVPQPRRRLQRLLSMATAGYAIVLVIATHYPRPQEILLRLGAENVLDKTQHLVAYGGLGLLAAATLAAWGRWTLWNVFLLLAALVLFGVVDEVTQPLFARFADPLDWVADCAGLTSGVLAVAVGVALLGTVRPASGGGVSPALGLKKSPRR
jgi:VanZ family protein